METIENREAISREDAPGDMPQGARRGALAGLLGARAGYLVLGALAAGLVVGFLQYSTRGICCGDFDGYYHIRWSQLLWEGARAGQFPPRFTWLPLTTLNPRDYVDHHFLFHLLQAPFAVLSERYTGSAVAGAKISAWLFASLAVFACYWLVVRDKLRFPVLWLVALLACSAPFLFRMNMTKAMSVSIVLLVVGINLMFRRRYVWLLPLAFLFTLTYDMFVLLGVAAVLWAAVVAWSERRFEWRPLVYVGAGAILGLVINPYFPHNLVLLYQHAVMKFKVTEQGRPSVGNEWYPYETWDFFGNSVVACAAMVVGYLACRWEERERAARALFFMLFSTLLLVVHLKWRRFAEYWPPFAVLFAAFSVSSFLEGARTVYGRLPADVMDELRPLLDGAEARASGDGARRESWRFACAAVAAVALLAPLGANLYAERKEIGDSDPPEAYRAGAAWLRANVPAGETVFNTDWDDFPKLFFYDPTHAYVSGLDPTYLYDASPELSKLYEQITLGKEKDPGPLIRERFGARYVFTDNAEVHDAFYDAAMDSGWFEEAYADDTCTILRVRERKGEPPEAGGDDADQPDGAAPPADDAPPAGDT